MATKRTTRGRNEGTIRQHSSGRWEVRIVINSQRKSFYYDTETEAKRERRQLLAKRDKGAVIVTDHQTTLAKYLTEWFASKMNLRPTSRLRYEAAIRLYLIPALGKVKLASLTKAQAVEFYHKLEAKGDISWGTICRIHAVLRTALNDAVGDEIIPRNVVAGIKGMTPRHKEMTTWTPEQAAIFLDAIVDDPLEAFYVLALTTGMRRGEIAALHWKDVDLAKGVLTVKYTLRDLKGGQFAFDQPKTEAGRREIPLTATAIAALERRKRAQKAEKLAAGAEWSNDRGLIFTMPLGNPQRPNHILQRKFEPLCKRLGLPRIRLHDLRHTNATWLYAMGYQDKEIAALLGHRDTAVTREVYAHVDPTRLRGAASDMDALLRQKRQIWANQG